MKSIQIIKLVFVFMVMLFSGNYLQAQFWNGPNSTTDPIQRTGDVGIGIFSIPLYKLWVRSTNGTNSSTSIAARGRRPNQNTYFTRAIWGTNPSGFGSTYGVVGTSFSGTSNSGNNSQAFGVLGEAGNARDNYNIGVMGIVKGSNKGAGIMGYDQVNFPNWNFNTEGSWAGYFRGSVHVSENVGIGTTSPTKKLHVHGGNAIIKGKGNFSNPGDRAILCIGDDNHFIKSEFAKGVTLGTYNHPNGIFLEESTGNMQVGNGISKISIGSAYGQLTEYGTSYVGYNAARSSTGNWLFSTDLAHNGGSVIYSNVGGALNFVTVASLDPSAGGNSNQTLTDLQIVDQIKMKIEADGKVVIGTRNMPGTINNINTSAFKLFVNGGIATEEVVVATGWADYVFEDNYKLTSLQEAETHIQETGHLHNMPSAYEIESNGLELGEMTVKQQEKIEELFLHLIEMDKRMKVFETENIRLKEELLSKEK